MGGREQLSLNGYGTRAHLLENNLKKITFLSKIIPKLDNLIGSECQDYTMKWIGLIGLFLCGSAKQLRPLSRSM
jgi:hypothetical protein